MRDQRSYPRDRSRVVVRDDSVYLEVPTEFGCAWYRASCTVDEHDVAWYTVKIDGDVRLLVTMRQAQVIAAMDGEVAA